MEGGVFEDACDERFSEDDGEGVGRWRSTFGSLSG